MMQSPINIRFYSLFWAIPQCLNFICEHFATLCYYIFIGGVGRKNNWNKIARVFIQIKVWLSLSQTWRPGFKHLVSGTVTLQLPGASALISNMQKVRCIQWVSSKYNIVAWNQSCHETVLSICKKLVLSICKKLVISICKKLTAWNNLMFRWPCIMINSYNKTNQMH